MSEKRKLIAISGGFDPVHVGHVQMIEEAAQLGDVMVIVNSDDWLIRKKGYKFMPWSEKAYIMGQFKGVVKVVSVDELLAQVWGAEFRGEPQVVYVHIRWLRKKIETDPSHPQRIVTVHGVGYKLETSAT